MSENERVNGTIAERVAALVDRYGSDDKLAAATGKTRQQIIDWRKGKHEPQRPNREVLAAAEGSDPEEWHALARQRDGRSPSADEVAALREELVAVVAKADEQGELVAALRNGQAGLGRQVAEIVRRLDDAAKSGGQ